MCLGRHSSEDGSGYTRNNSKAQILSDTGLGGGWRSHRSHRSDLDTLTCVQISNIREERGNQYGDKLWSSRGPIYLKGQGRNRWLGIFLLESMGSKGNWKGDAVECVSLEGRAPIFGGKRNSFPRAFQACSLTISMTRTNGALRVSKARCEPTP